MALRLALFGAAGRMGRAVSRAASVGGHHVVMAVGSHRSLGQDAAGLAGLPLSGVLVASKPNPDLQVDVWIDFAPAEGIKQRASYILAQGGAWVCGSTGLSDAQMRVLNDTSARLPVLWEPNFSVGVHVLRKLVREASSSLGEAFEIEIVEAHHGAKRDAPSGTAKRLQSDTGRADVPVHALRGGDVIGDHTVHFMGLGERLELTHRATDRDLFARGALRAATWIAGQPAGYFGLSDVLSSAKRGS